MRGFENSRSKSSFYTHYFERLTMIKIELIFNEGGVADPRVSEGCQYKNPKY